MQLPTFIAGGEALADELNVLSDATQQALDQSVPAGGAIGQVLGKTGAADHEVGWLNPDGGSPGQSLPPGGDAGDLLGKASSADGDALWLPPPIGLPEGGTEGQLLERTGDGYGWTDPPEGGDGGTPSPAGALLGFSSGESYQNIVSTFELPASRRRLPVVPGTTYLATVWCPLSVIDNLSPSALDALTVRLAYNGTAFVNASWRLAQTGGAPKSSRVNVNGTQYWTAPAGADAGVFSIIVYGNANLKLTTYTYPSGATGASWGYTLQPLETGEAA